MCGTGHGAGNHPDDAFVEHTRYDVIFREVVLGPSWHRNAFLPERLDYAKDSQDPEQKWEIAGQELTTCIGAGDALLSLPCRQARS
jgi:hypothetical protein